MIFIDSMLFIGLILSNFIDSYNNNNCFIIIISVI